MNGFFRLASCVPELRVGDPAFNAARILELYRRAEEEGRTFVIAPSVPMELGRMEKDREKLDAIYRLGKRDTEERLDALLDFLKN